MNQPRYQRRKEERPQEITDAALAAFAKNGYAATKVDEVAKRAGVSKGLLYLYFKTKEDLFKSVVRSFVVPRIDTLSRIIETSDLSSEEFLRGPFLDFARQLPGSPVGVIVRLMIAEGPKHPDLVQFYWDNVVSRGFATITDIAATRRQKRRVSGQRRGAATRPVRHARHHFNRFQFVVRQGPHGQPAADRNTDRSAYCSPQGPCIMNARIILFLLSTAVLLHGCDTAADSYRVVGELASDRIELGVEAAEPIVDNSRCRRRSGRRRPAAVAAGRAACHGATGRSRSRNAARHRRVSTNSCAGRAVNRSRPRGRMLRGRRRSSSFASQNSRG